MRRENSSSQERTVHTNDGGEVHVVFSYGETAAERFKLKEKRVREKYETALATARKNFQELLSRKEELGSASRKEKRNSTSSPAVEAAIERIDGDIKALAQKIATLEDRKNDEIKQVARDFKKEVELWKKKNKDSLEREAATGLRADHVRLEALRAEVKKVTDAQRKEREDLENGEVDKALETISRAAPTYDELVTNKKIQDIGAYEKAASKASQKKALSDKAAEETDLKDSLRLPVRPRIEKAYATAAGSFDQDLKEDTLIDKNADHTISTELDPADVGAEDTIANAEIPSLNYAVRFPETDISYRSREYVRLPATGKARGETVRLVKVPEVIVDQASEERGVTFTYQRNDGSTETKTYYEPLEKITPQEIQQIYNAGDLVRIPEPRGGFIIVRLTDKPSWNWESATDEVGYTYTYKKENGETETKTYYEPLEKVEEIFNPQDLAVYNAEDEIELTIKDKKIKVRLTEKPRLEFDENAQQKILFSYDLGNGVVGTHYTDTLPPITLAGPDKQLSSIEKDVAQKGASMEIDALPDLTSEATVESYPSLEINGDSISYTFGEYVLYEAGGTWQIGSIQAEPRLTRSTGQIEFTVQNARTGVVERITVEKPLNKYNPLDSKKVRVNGIDYTVEGGHIGLNGEIEYQLLSRRNEVIQNVDIETIRNLQETEKVSKELKDKIASIEARINSLATHKIRDLTVALNDLEFRLQSFETAFGSPTDWNTYDKKDIQDMLRTIKKNRHELTRAATLLDESIREQEHLYQQYEDAFGRKNVREDVEKDMARLGITEKLKLEDEKKYYRLLEMVFNDLAHEPGNPLYQEIQARWADYSDALGERGDSDEYETKVTRDASGVENVEQGTRHLRIMEEILKDWRKEAGELKPPQIDFEKEFAGEKGILPELEKIKAEVGQLEKNDKEKYDRIAEQFYALESAVDKIKKDDPKLPLTLLKAWQTIGKVQLTLEAFKSEDRKKGRERKEGVYKLDRVELPTKVLNEMLEVRPAEMRKVIELIYLSHHQLDGNDETPLSERRFIINENPAITAAMQNLFRADLPPAPPLMAMLRIYGVKDWKSFKEVWDKKYAPEVGMALYASIVNDIRQQALATESKSYAIKNEGLLGKLFGSKDKNHEEAFEGDNEKIQRVASTMFGGELSLQPNGSRDWLSSEVITKYAAEMAMAIRQVNIEFNLQKTDWGKLGQKERVAVLAATLGIPENQVDHMIEEKDIDGKKQYFLKKNARSIIEEQLAALEETMGFDHAASPKETLSPAKVSESGPDSIGEENSFDDELLLEKRQELAGINFTMSSRLERVAQLRNRFKDTWMDLEEVKGAMSKLADEVRELKSAYDGTSTDKAMVDLIKSPAIKPVVEELMLEGEVCYSQFRNALESKSRVKHLRAIEGGLSKVEESGRKHVAEITPEQRRVLSSLREKKGGHPLKWGVAAAGLIALAAQQGVFKAPKDTAGPGGPRLTRSSEGERKTSPRIQLVDGTTNQVLGNISTGTRAPRIPKTRIAQN